MTLFSLLSFAAAIFSLVLAVASLLLKHASPARWWLFGGMTVLGIGALFVGLCMRATELAETLRWITLGSIAESFVPVTWLGFSLNYSRGDSSEFLARWKIPLAIIALLPIALSLLFQQQLLEIAPTQPASEEIQLRFGLIGKAWNVIFLVALVWILTNLEQTFRSAVGTMRWRVKLVVLGLAVIFGARVYVRSQALLFSAYQAHWSGVESSALLIGCVFLVAAYLRTGFTEIDVYPSRIVLGSSLTVVVVGGYLFFVGILAHLVGQFGGAESFQLQAFVLLVGMAGVGLLLLSDRLRQRTHDCVARHFGRSQHDSVRIWAEFSRRLANVKDQAALCAVSARLVSETFGVLSVTIWLLDEQNEQFIAGACTAPQPGEATAGDPPAAASSAVATGLRVRSSPFDLEAVDEPSAGELRQLNPTVFPNGGKRWCVPLRAGEQSLGVLVLADRVNGADYTVEELQLLQCIADQVTSVLLNLRLADEVVRSKELEAFWTMSAFIRPISARYSAGLSLRASERILVRRLERRSRQRLGGPSDRDRRNISIAC